MKTYAAWWLPSEVSLQPGKHLQVSEEPLRDICAEYEEHPNGLKVPKGLRLVSSLDASNLDEAETLTRALAMNWGSTFCLTMGVPVVFPRPLVILQEIDRAARYRFRGFFYDVLPVKPFRILSAEEWFRVHVGLNSIEDSELSERAALAVRWYGLGLGEPDASIKFLSYWIALEALGNALNSRFHKSGTRTRCSTCQNDGKASRHRTEAGMHHILSLVSANAELYVKMRNARNDMFHGLKDLAEITLVLSNTNIRHLETSVIRAILTVITPPDSNEEMVALRPERWQEHAPQVLINGTLLNLSEEEIRQILYRNAINVEAETTSANTDPDGTLAISSNFAVSITIDPAKLVDQQIRHFTLPSVDLTLRPS